MAGRRENTYSGESVMILMQGKGVSKGLAEGRVYFLKRGFGRVVRSDAGDAETE